MAGLGDLARQVDASKEQLDVARREGTAESAATLQEDRTAWSPETALKLLAWIETWQEVLPSWRPYFARRRGRTLGTEEVTQLWSMLTNLYEGLQDHVFDRGSLLEEADPTAAEGARVESPHLLDRWDALMAPVDAWHTFITAPERGHDPPRFADTQRMQQASQQIRREIPLFVKTTLEELDEIGKLAREIAED
jgi:hypothetical protein